jgi:hypothetical protein
MVVRMSDNNVDPSGNTEAFRAFTHNAPAEPAPAASKTPLIIGVAAVAIVLIAVIAWLALS